MSTLKLDAEKTLDFVDCSFNFQYVSLFVLKLFLHSLTSKNLSQDSKQLNSDMETANEFLSFKYLIIKYFARLSVAESRDESYKEPQQSILFKDEPEMYPGMKKKPSKSILKKSSTIEFNSQEFVISDVSLKEDELNGRLKKKECRPKLVFKEDITISYVASYKRYNGTGEYVSDDGNCSCMIF